MIRLRHESRPKPMEDLETLTTEQVLELHERHFGPLDLKAKARIVYDARMRGWDRTWEPDWLAA